MGLDVSHDCFHGAYSRFMVWRERLCEVAGLPPLTLMEGFYQRGTAGADPFYMIDDSHYTAKRVLAQLPIRWECIKPSPLHILLRHSDCDGEIECPDCGPIADALEALIPALGPSDPNDRFDMVAMTLRFINGLRAAVVAGENVEFY